MTAGSAFALVQGIGMGASVPALVPLITGAVVTAGTYVGVRLWSWAKAAFNRTFR